MINNNNNDTANISAGTHKSDIAFFFLKIVICRYSTLRKASLRG
jgi:hypothetical protein